MQYQFLDAISTINNNLLDKKQNKTLLLFFHGWSGDLSMLSHLKLSEQSHLDILVIYNYQSLTLPHKLVEQIKSYTKIHLVAWSFGVWVANHVCTHHHINLSSSIAYNGSLFPIHNELGIPLRVAQITLKTLSEKNWELFLKQMTLKIAPQYTKNFYKEGQIETHKQSLIFLYQCFKQPLKNNLFKQAIIGSNDVIIPTSAQKKAWNQLNTSYQLINAPHYPFARYNNWQNLLEKTL